MNKIKEDMFQKIHLEILDVIKPSKNERKYIDETLTKIIGELSVLLQKNDIKGHIEIGGSYARDTWLAGKHDLDVFIILPRESKLEPNALLQIIENNTDYHWVKKHADHPYLATKIEHLEIEIIPCYKYKTNKPMRSAVDRSPEHNDFVQSHLPVGAEDEVRLLKQFMRCIEVYGAEIKIQGFSGYLAELLIIYYDNSFLEVIRNAQSLPGKVISLRKEKPNNLKKHQNDVFIFIDPTDPNRNVAAAVSNQKLYEFIAAAKNYLHNPKKSFFLKSKKEVKKSHFKEIQKNELILTVIYHQRPKVVDDVLWGQLRRFESSLFQTLDEFQLEPVIIDSFVTPKKISTIILTRTAQTPSTIWVKGPPVYLCHQQDFLKNYLNNKEVLYGPVIRNDRWHVLLKKNPISIIPFLKDKIIEKQIALPSHLQLSPKNLLILKKKAYLEKIRDDPEQIRYLLKLLQGTPSYLKN
ncbi:MAG: CCA tRNA nucleotidyltransferase [Asgard group archaeon]|nr:CCA tRNA nucleotidyltransferase [Asgard group archaeon]